MRSFFFFFVSSFFELWGVRDLIRVLLWIEDFNFTHLLLFKYSNKRKLKAESSELCAFIFIYLFFPVKWLSDVIVFFNSMLNSCFIIRKQNVSVFESF